MTIHYERVPSLDRRQGRGDDFSGDAWVRWVAVGQIPQDPVPDLLAALEGAQEELRLIRMKDTAACYDPTIRIRIHAAITKAKGEA